jgi:hypothetical protein
MGIEDSIKQYQSTDMAWAYTKMAAAAWHAVTEASDTGYKIPEKKRKDLADKIKAIYSINNKDHPLNAKAKDIAEAEKSLKSMGLESASPDAYYESIRDGLVDAILSGEADAVNKNINSMKSDQTYVQVRQAEVKKKVQMLATEHTSEDWKTYVKKVTGADVSEDTIKVNLGEIAQISYLSKGFTENKDEYLVELKKALKIKDDKKKK